MGSWAGARGNPLSSPRRAQAAERPSTALGETTGREPGGVGAAKTSSVRLAPSNEIRGLPASEQRAFAPVV